jgi:hypothetical protein
MSPEFRWTPAAERVGRNGGLETVLVRIGRQHLPTPTIIFYGFREYMKSVLALFC